MNPHHLKKRQRTESILLSINKLDYLTRTQLQQLHDLGGDRNANRVLTGLGEYVLSFRNGLEKVYYLSQEGRSFINSDNIRHRTKNADHFILRNQLYIYYNRPFSWKSESQILLDKMIIIPDAFFVYQGVDMFAEIDIQQSMKNNIAKINRYKKLKQMTTRPFCLIFVTDIDSRKEKLKRQCEGLDFKIYTAKEIM